MDSYPKDFAGRAIQPGQEIAYATREGDRAVLHRGKVLTLIQAVGRLSWSITAEIDSTKYDHNATAPPYFVPVKRKVTLSYPNRIVVIR